ncbi:MAG: DUF5131 family protein [Clostridia bacterium]|nr:DUF5131 family protein [Clostridia bacterium]
MDHIWNPWHGCRKFSSGCINCYMFRRDESVGRDPTVIAKTKDFSLPLRRKANGAFRLESASNVYTCMTSDFFIEEADQWRGEAWEIIKSRPDLLFIIITKRIHRASECFPDDWGGGYPNVLICLTVEDQLQCDKRMPILLSLPLKKKAVICEPLLEPIDFSEYLDSSFEYLSCGGESGPGARECDYSWVLDIREQCIDAYVPFEFHQTGANFIKNGRRFSIPRSSQHSQAKKANIDT